MNMNERNLKRLSEAELINMVEKLQNKARKPKIAIVDDGNGQVLQPALPRLRDAKGRFISRQQSEPVVQQVPIQILENQNAQNHQNLRDHHHLHQ